MSREQNDTVIVTPPQDKPIPDGYTCFAIMHPLHGEPFTRYFPDLATYRRLRDHHFTGTYRAFEVATLDSQTNTWIASQSDIFYGGSLYSGEQRFLPPTRRGT